VKRSNSTLIISDSLAPRGLPPTKAGMDGMGATEDDELPTDDVSALPEPAVSASHCRQICESVARSLIAPLLQTQHETTEQVLDEISHSDVF